MTKPQFAPEPSMEDILASIRKMISEDRLGPRPVPDQIARTSIGERPAASTTPAPTSPTTKSETPAQLREPSLPTPPSGATERPVPSFSSLSDALKSAAVAPTPRRSLDERLAALLDEQKSASDGQSAKPATPLSVYSASRPASATPDAAAPPTRGLSLTERTQQVTGLHALTETARAQPAPSKGDTLPDAGSADAAGATPPPAQSVPSIGQGMHKSTVSPTAERPLSAVPSSPKVPSLKSPDEEIAKQSAALPDEAPPDNTTARDTHARDDDDNQTVILMPSRFSSGAGTPHVGGATNGSGLNGHASVIGLRQQPEAPPHDDEPAEEPAADSLSEEPADALDLPADPSMLFKLEPVLPELAEDDEASVEFELDDPETDDVASSPSAMAPSVLASAELFAGSSSKVDASKKAGNTEAVAAEADASPAGMSDADGPSETLIDAVMEMVQKQPETLSVFTSGDSFIHGAKPRDAGNAANPANPAAPQKLDGAAAELLRPMLRQWLADNMPRIVEDALRSELMSTQGSGSQGTTQGPKKG